MSLFHQKPRIGILGGGQLGRMLIQAGMNFNLEIHVLDPDHQAPCKDLCSQFTCGSLTDFDTVYAFGQEVDMITIEIENVNTDALKKLVAEGKKVFPEPEVIDIIRNKRIQKVFYTDNNLPTSEYILTNTIDDVKAQIGFLPAFQKLGVGGYDGGGVKKLSSVHDLDAAFTAPSLLEKLVDIDKEISVIVAQNASGEICAFPAVECVYHPAYNLVDYLLAPAEINDELAEKAATIAKEVIQKLKMTGLLAVELFVTKNQEILVNEVAPRPHNSGHQTINANFTSQYEQLWRAILDLPLGATETICHSAMVNIIGEEGYTGEAIYEGIEDLMKVHGASLFLYGKKLTKPHRKMGHVTIMARNRERLNNKVEAVKKAIKVIANTSIEDKK